MFVAQERQHDFDRIIEFFDRLLRHDSKCRIYDEYPLVFNSARSRVISVDPQTDNYLSGKLLGQFDENIPAHIFVFEERGELKAGLASLIREIEVEPNRFAKFCFVGSVITQPAYRQQGLQKELFHVLTNACFESKVDFICLWSNQLDFYQKLGYSLGGLQATWSSNVLVKLNNSGIKVIKTPSEKMKFNKKFFDHFSKRRLKVQRSQEEMSQLFSIPNMSIYHSEDAYALVGKGEDFPGVCHEWAGPSDHVLACIEAAWRDHPQLRILSPGVVHSPDEAAVVEALEQNAFESRLEYLALFRCLNPEFQMTDLQPENLKYPFFIWGLDSI